MFWHQCPCVCVCACVHFWWCNMPAIHQTRLSTCGLTLSLQLLKYVVSNYWNMYATSVPRNFLWLSHILPHNQEYYSTSRFKGLTMQSHQTVRGIGTLSGCLVSPQSAWKWRKYEIWIERAGQGRFLYVELVHWLIARSPLANTRWQGLQPEKQICWIIGSRLKTAAAPFSKRVSRMWEW